MDADVILVCEGIGRSVTDDPPSDLKRLKELRNIFKSGHVLYGERVFALTMKNLRLKKKKQNRAKEEALKKCWILSRDAERVFFIAQPKSLIGLLAVKGVSASDMEESQLIRLLGRKGGGEP